MSELRHCSQHPKCKGPSLIVDHASKCPDGNMEDCDNDHCWMPCKYCITDDQVVDLGSFQIVLPPEPKRKRK